MRIIFIFFLLISMNVQATKYYVANAGSDAANGLTTGTAWQHISKVNSTVTIGDSVLFNSGDSWNEKLIPADNNIYYGSYGTGNKPIISGWQTVGSWTNVTGNIWRAITSTPVNGLNTVLINGSFSIKARYPNSSYLTFTSGTTTQLTTSLSGTPNYTGFEAVIRTNRFVIDKSTVSSQTTGTLNLSTSLSYTPSSGFGFFLQNDSSLIDTLNEYSYNSITGALIVYSVGSPTVQVSNIDTLVWLKKNTGVTFDGISFAGSNSHTFQLDTVNSITIKNCSIKYSGQDGITATKSTNVKILNDSISYCYNNGITMRDFITTPIYANTCDSAKIDGIFVKNIGRQQGMGIGKTSNSVGICIVGLRDTITNNRSDSCGYIGIEHFGQFHLVKNNFVNTFCFNKDDGGGIYSYAGIAFPDNFDSGTITRKNICINGIGAGAGTNTGIGYFAPGLYFDGNDNGQLIDSNTVFNCLVSGVLFNNNRYQKFYDNTIINSIGDCFFIAGIAGNTNSTVSNLIVKRNIFFSLSATQYCINRDQTDLTESIDSNYYPSAISKLKLVATTYSSLPSWTAATGYDTHSSAVPSGITGTYLFWYNPTSTDSVFTIPATYVDVKGNYYYGYSSENKVTLKPYSSLLLFKTTGEIYSGTIYGNQNKIR